MNKIASVMHASMAETEEWLITKSLREIGQKTLGVATRLLLTTNYATPQ